MARVLGFLWGSIFAGVGTLLLSTTIVSGDLPSGDLLSGDPMETTVPILFALFFIGYGLYWIGKALMASNPGSTEGD